MTHDFLVLGLDIVLCTWQIHVAVCNKKLLQAGRQAAFVVLLHHVYRVIFSAHNFEAVDLG